MADRNDKQARNVAGRYYVDAQCIDCDVCRDMAPDHFMRDDEDAYSYVYRQPESPAELELCAEALQSCPVDAIGDDGV